MDYRSDLEASRLRINTLEAKLEESEASLKVREAELAECKSELEKLRKTSGNVEPKRKLPIVPVVLVFSIGAMIGTLIGNRASVHEDNVAVGAALPAAEEYVREPPPIAEGRTKVPPPEPPAPVAVVAGQTSTGAEEPKTIESIVQDARPKVRACFQAEADRRPDTRGGAVNVEFDLDPSGKVSRVALSELFKSVAPWWSKDFEACVVGVYRSLEFPKTEGTSKTTAEGRHFFTSFDRRQ